jgi:hypothetical protein
MKSRDASATDGDWRKKASFALADEMQRYVRIFFVSRSARWLAGLFTAQMLNGTSSNY